MSVTLALVVGGLTSVGVYLITSRSLTRMLLGFALLGHAAVVALLAAGGEAGERPISGDAPVDELSDPLPQAFALTKRIWLHTCPNCYVYPFHRDRFRRRIRRHDRSSRLGHFVRRHQ